MLTLTPTEARANLYKRLASDEPTRIVGARGSVSYLLPAKMVEESVTVKRKVTWAGRHE
jgi:hypothetical protein